MKAIVIETFGGVDQLVMKDIEKPELKPDRMLVEMHATSVNPIDIKRRKGDYGGKLPIILGGDVSGKVIEVGEAVTDFKVGDRVMANGSKTYAEIVSVRPDKVVILDESISYEEAAAVPLTGQTAYEALVRRGKVQKDSRVLIHAGSGGVGSLAIQIAKNKGAWVAATASTSNQELLKALGADRAINYEKEAFDEVLEDIDFVLDTIGGSVLEKSLYLIKNKGKLLSIAGDPGDYVDTEIYDAGYFSMKPTKDALDQLHDWLVERKLKPVISDVIPFKEESVKEAHNQSEAGHVRGKLIIKMKD